VRIGDRHLWKESSLDKASDYIESVLDGMDTTSGGRHTRVTAKASQISLPKRRHGQGTVVVGAHYDTVPGTPGRMTCLGGCRLAELARLHGER